MKLLTMLLFLFLNPMPEEEKTPHKQLDSVQGGGCTDIHGNLCCTVLPYMDNCLFLC